MEVLRSLCLLAKRATRRRSLRCASDKRCTQSFPAWKKRCHSSSAAWLQTLKQVEAHSCLDHFLLCVGLCLVNSDALSFLLEASRARREGHQRPWLVLTDHRRHHADVRSSQTAWLLSGSRPNLLMKGHQLSCQEVLTQTVIQPLPLLWSELQQGLHFWTRCYWPWSSTVPYQVCFILITNFDFFVWSDLG